MSYDHKISDLKYRINKLVPKSVCNKMINIFEKYPELTATEKSYKYKSKSFEVDNFKSLNLSEINNPNKDIQYCLNQAKNYIHIMIINYVTYIKSKKISPDFNSELISISDNIRILKYERLRKIKKQII